MAFDHTWCETLGTSKNQASLRAVITKPREGSGNQGHPRACPETTGLAFEAAAELAGGCSVPLTALRPVGSPVSRWGPARAQPLASPQSRSKPAVHSTPRAASSLALGCTWCWAPTLDPRPGLRAAACGPKSRDLLAQAEWALHPGCRVFPTCVRSPDPVGPRASVSGRLTPAARGWWWPLPAAPGTHKGPSSPGLKPRVLGFTSWAGSVYELRPLEQVPQQGGLKSRNVFSHRSGGGKCQPRGFLVGSPSWTPPPPGPVSSCRRRRYRTRDLTSLRIRTQILLDQGHTFVISYNLKCLHESSVSRDTLGVQG